MIWRRLLAILCLLLSGAILIPFEQRLGAEAQAAHLCKSDLNLDLRERIGQMGFLAALSGFRSPFAAFLWIEAYTAWENTEWGRMAWLFDTVTTLQPRSVPYWDLSAWHMAWNAGTAALQNEKQPSEALRIRAQRQYLQIGRDLLERGIRNNPDSFQLYTTLGRLLADKMDDPSGAADAYLSAASIPGAPAYCRRFAAYEMAKSPGREREAYALARSIYEQGDKQRMPTLLRTLQDLEKKLDIPPTDRIKTN